MENKIKDTPSTEEIIEIDEFIKRYKNYKGDFDFNARYHEYYKEHPRFGESHKSELYNLVAHKTNIISLQGHGAKRYEFTAKGLEILEKDGYNKWVCYKRWESIKSNFDFLLKVATILLSLASFIWSTSNYNTIESLKEEVIAPMQLQDSMIYDLVKSNKKEFDSTIIQLKDKTHKEDSLKNATSTP